MCRMDALCRPLMACRVVDRRGLGDAELAHGAHVAAAGVGEPAGALEAGDRRLVLEAVVLGDDSSGEGVDVGGCWTPMKSMPSSFMTTFIVICTTNALVVALRQRMPLRFCVLVMIVRLDGVVGPATAWSRGPGDSFVDVGTGRRAQRTRRASTSSAACVAAGPALAVVAVVDGHHPDVVAVGAVRHGVLDSLRWAFVRSEGVHDEDVHTQQSEALLGEVVGEIPGDLFDDGGQGVQRRPGSPCRARRSRSLSRLRALLRPAP